MLDPGKAATFWRELTQEADAIVKAFNKPHPPEQRGEDIEFFIASEYHCYADTPLLAIRLDVYLRTNTERLDVERRENNHRADPEAYPLAGSDARELARAILTPMLDLVAAERASRRQR
jgi:hypothetical protein